MPWQELREAWFVQDYARINNYEFVLGIRQLDPELENMWNKPGNTPAPHFFLGFPPPLPSFPFHVADAQFGGHRCTEYLLSCPELAPDFLSGRYPKEQPSQAVWLAAWINKVLADEENPAEWVLWMDIDTVVLDANYTLPFEEFAAKSKDLVVYGNQTEVQAGHPVRGAFTPPPSPPSFSCVHQESAGALRLHWACACSSFVWILNQNWIFLYE